jgi:hypothetical protein
MKFLNRIQNNITDRIKAEILSNLDMTCELFDAKFGGG